MRRTARKNKLLIIKRIQGAGRRTKTAVFRLHSFFTKNLKKMKKMLAMPGIIVYTNNRCDMIAMKREVAARK